MKNFIAHGHTLTLTAPSGGVTAGVPVVIGALLVIPKQSVDQGEQFTAEYRGIFKIAKAAADTPAQLAKAYWNSSNSELTTTATGNKLVGLFAEVGIATVAEVEVLLTGEF